MKLVTFNHPNDGGYRVGALVSDTEIADLTTFVSNTGLSAYDVLDCFDLDGSFYKKARTAVDNGDFPAVVKRSDVKLASPVPRPGKIICIGLNYRDHAAESGMEIPKSPIIFSKFSSCAIGADKPIVIPEGCTQLDYEAELAFIVGRRARNISRDKAFDHVFGY